MSGPGFSTESWRARATRSLERGGWDSPLARTLARVWARSVRPERPVTLPRGARVIGVGGATLGGSYKTPLVLEIARSLAGEGRRVAVAAHAYRSEAAAPVRVDPHTPVRSVGDEASWLSRELSTHRVPVFAGRERTRVLEEAARVADVIVADALLQTAPERLSLSILSLDAARPWGAGAYPPHGDLRAPPDRLLSCTDVVALVQSGSAKLVPELLPVGVAVHALSSHVLGARGASGELVSLRDLGRLRVGVVLAIARPERVLEGLHAEGIAPDAVRLFADHSTPDRARAPDPDVAVWLTTGKCATKLGPTYAGRPLLALEHRVSLSDGLLREITSRLGNTTPSS